MMKVDKFTRFVYGDGVYHVADKFSMHNFGLGDLNSDTMSFVSTCVDGWVGVRWGGARWGVGCVSWGEVGAGSGEVGCGRDGAGWVGLGGLVLPRGPANSHDFALQAIPSSASPTGAH